mmetsp:Transcript_52637/g.159530  ORF Transcript_52637/g.159530 Transcript_52637/m.159530 type:complete len:202 (-) Transcript_52637:432-1037(-)
MPTDEVGRLLSVPGRLDASASGAAAARLVVASHPWRLANQAARQAQATPMAMPTSKATMTWLAVAPRLAAGGCAAGVGCGVCMGTRGAAAPVSRCVSPRRESECRARPTEKTASTHGATPGLGRAGARPEATRTCSMLSRTWLGLLRTRAATNVAAAATVARSKPTSMATGAWPAPSPGGSRRARNPCAKCWRLSATPAAA